MHAWEGHSFDDIARLTVKRDPRRYPVGCLTANTTVYYLQWFRTVPELAQYLLRMEPQRWGIRAGDLIERKSRLQPILTEVDVMGLKNSLRQALNAVTNPLYRIEWWGSFESFRHTPELWPDRLHEAVGENADAEEIIRQLRVIARETDQPMNQA